MAKDNGVLIAAIVAGAFLLTRKDESGQPVFNLGGLTGGEAPSFGLDGSGIFENLGAGLGGMLNNLGLGLGTMIAGFQMPQIDIPQIPNLFPTPTPNGGAGQTPHVEPTSPNQSGGNGGFWQTPTVAPTGNVFTDLGNTISQTAMSVAKAGLVGGATYLGAKALAPVVSTAGQGAATIIRAGVPAAKSVVSSGGRVVTSLAGNAARALTSPVSKVVTGSVGGAVGTGLAVIGAGAAGYAAGSWFNTTPAGQALIEKSGEAGAAFARTSIGQKVFGVAQVNTSKTSVQLIQEAQAQGLTGQAAIAYARQRLGK